MYWYVGMRTDPGNFGRIMLELSVKSQSCFTQTVSHIRGQEERVVKGRFHEAIGVAGFEIECTVYCRSCVGVS